MKIQLNDNNSYWQTDVPDVVMQSIHHELDNDFDGHEYNYALAGNIMKEYILEQCFDDIEFFTTEQARMYTGKDYKLDDLWVNMSQKYEFNPPHSHGGSISFVIFVHIPYSIDNEIERFHKCKDALAGHFSFLYCDGDTIAQEYLPVDYTYENKMFMFDSKLKHSVFPFYTSDQYRITVAGNLILA